jgi:hypothetical protein
VIKKKLSWGGSNAALLGEVDKFCYGFSLHLLHNPATVNLYRLKGSPPLSGNLLAQHPFGYESENFQFS